ncbi:MAG: hypothetical protein ACXACC_04160, partial [Promethearchaeota archaeon]
KKSIFNCIKFLYVISLKIKTLKKSVVRSMAKKKKVVEQPEFDEVPGGKPDEEGDEIIDLYDEQDNLEEDLDYDLSKIKDEMLADETEDEEFGYEVNEVEALVRKVKCEPCPGSSSKSECKIRNDFGCPPDKAKK